MRAVAQLSLQNIGGWRVTLCDGGADALLAIRRERPDLVLMDIQMPVQGGRETARMMRQDAFTATLPIIFVTGEERPDLATDLALGVILKPFNPARLPQQVLALWEARTTPDVKSDAFTASLRGLRREYAGRLHRMLETLDRLEASPLPAPEDAEDALRQAHKIAGSAATLGFPAVTEAARAAEHALGGLPPSPQKLPDSARLALLTLRTACKAAAAEAEAEHN